jgi:hypothetical protein
MLQSLVHVLANALIGRGARTFSGRESVPWTGRRDESKMAS